jgi:hypothetical protein
MELQLSARDYKENWLDACRLLDEREAEIERLRAALTDLVKLKNMKDQIDNWKAGPTATMRAEYEKRKPAAWDRARALTPNA